MPRLERASVHLARTLSSLRHRDFRLLFFGTSLSHVGDFIQVMAQSWLVWTMTGSPFLLGVVGFCQAVPRLLLGAVGGAFVDRMERRPLLLSTQILAMIQAFAFWALVFFDEIQFWHIIVLVLFLGTVNSINQTARHSLINNLVPRAELMNAIALNSSMANLAKIAGPSLGGVLISVIGVAGCLFVNAVSFLAIIVTLLVMAIPAANTSKAKATPFWAEVQEGYRFLRGERRLFAVILLTYAVALVGTPYSRFLPVIATDVLHAGASTFGLLLSRRCDRRPRNRIAWKTPPPSAFRRHERVRFRAFPDPLLVFPLSAAIDVVSRARRGKQYCVPRRGEFHRSNGNATAPPRSHVELVLHG